MSRIIVKNLPKQITDKKLKEIFSEKGVVTDVQLKYTPRGEFRKFGFIGFKTEEEAQAACNALNKSFINASQISVELCSGLDDPDKPRAWSKHAPEQQIKKNKRKSKTELEEPTQEKKKKKNSKIKDDKIIELLESHKDDVMFKEFMETHLPSSSEILPKTDEAEEKNEDENVREADKSISDLEYLQRKVVKTKEDKPKEKVKPIIHDWPTVKVTNLPIKVKKKDLKEFFRPAKIMSVRMPVNVKGFAYCDFENEAELKKALMRHRSFLGSKRVMVKIFKRDTVGEDKKEKMTKEEERLKAAETVAESGRIFIRNLSYTVVEDDLKPLFERFGPVTELTLPVDPLSRQSKGFGFVTFLIPEHAARALNELDGTVFHGRMLHLLPSLPKKEAEDDDDVGLSFREKKLKKQKAMTHNKVNWNSFFINENCLAEAMADTYKTTKENVLSEERGGAAVRLALGETEMVQKTKDFLVQNGVMLSAFENMGDAARSENVILVKNLPYSTDIAELREKFAKMGELSNLLLSPFGGTAIVEFIAPSEAKKAFIRLAYTKFKHIPLYLEWAPKNIFDGRSDKKTSVAKGDAADVELKSETKEEVKDEDDDETEEVHIPVEGATLYVKGINFSTNSETLKKHFEQCGPVVSAIVLEKRDPKNPGQKLSMGYGFVEFADIESADKALKNLQFSNLESHTIELKRSNRTTHVATTTRQQTKKGKPSTKIMVRNIPFQATQREIQELFKVFGEIKALRLPKKMVGTGSHRGFCFVDFHTIHDAKRAFKALSESTHLYGRRLVLEWAEADDDVETLRQKTAQKYTSSGQGDKKKKVDVDDIPEDED